MVIRYLYTAMINPLFHYQWNHLTQVSLFKKKTYNKYLHQYLLGNENVDKHDDKLSISSTKIDLKDKKDQTKKKHGFSTIVRIHAALMIFGWMGCMTVAILMVRFNRNSWPDKKLFGSKVWFAAHRYLMIIGWLAIVISYVVMFIETKGWHKVC